MRSRAALTSDAGARRVVADGVCLAAVYFLTLFLSSEIGNKIRGFDPLGPWQPLRAVSLGVLGAALALALVGFDRVAGAVALLFVATLLTDPAWRDQTIERREMMVVLVICFIGLALAPRRRKPSYRRLSWLAVTAALGIASSATDDPVAAVVVIGLIFLAPASLAMLRSNPRLAIACALPLTSFGIHMAQESGGPGILGTLFLLAAPLALTAAVAPIGHPQARTRI
jgi:hypothetical protein